MAEASSLPTTAIVAGSAAGEAVDPFTVPGGSSYAYDPTIDATLQLPDSSIFAGVEFYALDSFVFTSDDVGNFNEDGSPFADTLWFLSLAANGILSSTAGVEIDFELNPIAPESELLLPSSYLSTLPGYSAGLPATAIGPSIDNEIESRILQMLTFNDHSVTLQNFALFPADTLFRPVGGDVVFADGVAAVGSTVPSPASLWLFGAGLIGLAGMRLRPGTLRLRRLLRGDRCRSASRKIATICSSLNRLFLIALPLCRKSHLSRNQRSEKSGRSRLEFHGVVDSPGLKLRHAQMPRQRSQKMSMT
jgi:hypothetical protein